MRNTGEPGPPRSLERAIDGRGEAADVGLAQEPAQPAGRATRIAAARRRPLMFRFAGGRDSVALVGLGEAASLAEIGPRSS